MSDKITELMRKEGMSEAVIKSFFFYYSLLRQGSSGYYSEKDISPPLDSDILNIKSLTGGQIGDFSRLAVIKLNGGLGTSMGLERAKSLIPVKNNLNFLDIIARQILKLRQKTGQDIPLILLNSFNTSTDTLNHLSRYSDLKTGKLPLDIQQNKYPKICREDLSPLQLSEGQLNWNPPGHGEIYQVLQDSGLLEKLLNTGYEYAFLSNADNLGAVPDARILAELTSREIPFLMEVCLRTELDKKGGHLARSEDGHLILREVAQCPDMEVPFFQDITRYRYFNTNNIWVNLKALKREISQNEGFLSLPLIINRKEVRNIPVYQLETAMGAAISLFNGAKALEVGRDRFIPVKKTNDLLTIWSDAYELSEDYLLFLCDERTSPPVINLDDKYYRTIGQLEEHIRIVPSLKYCESLQVSGDFIFAGKITFRGRVKLKTERKKVLSESVFNNEEITHS
ncbi:MAG: UTP--glucose-1-phosphate uridylyltransferase [Candidatus Cloacimonetes bacterium]|nr:UTP--glucose-1-phosphate uridylyltransferase [Candidatus Cloacimonadota bacterium]